MRDLNYGSKDFLRERYYALRSSINQISEQPGEIMTRQQNSTPVEIRDVPSSGNTSLGESLGAGLTPGAPLSGEE